MALKKYPRSKKQLVIDQLKIAQKQLEMLRSSTYGKGFGEPIEDWYAVRDQHQSASAAVNYALALLDKTP